MRCVGIAAKLGQESESVLVSKSKGGDADAFMELAAEYAPVIRSKVMLFPMLEAEDLCQEGLLGLLNAARTYDVNRGVQFRKYAETCILNRLLSVARMATASETDSVLLYGFSER